MTTDQIIAATNTPRGYYNSRLVNWQRKFIADPTSVKIAWVGDSTSDLAGNAISTINLFSVASAAGGLMEGFNTANLINFGSTGNTLFNLVVNNVAQPGMTIQDVINAQPDLIDFCYGINDLRLNQETAAQLQALIIIAIDKLRAGCPNADIILRMPNSFKIPATNVYIQQGGYASLAAAAQAQSDILYNAYYGLIGYWPNVVVFNSQDLIYGRTCLATNANMSDDIHPIYTPMINRMITDLIGYRKPFDQPFATLALGQSYATPWTVYPRSLEDTGHYVKVTQGLLNGAITAGNLIDIHYPNADANKCPKLFPGDIVNIGDTAFFKLPYGCSYFYQNASTIRILASTIPADNRTNAVVTVYRSIYNHTQATEAYYDKRVTFPYVRRVVITGSGANTFDLGLAIDDNGLTTPFYTPFKTPSVYNVITAADTIIVDGQAPLLLTGATFAANGNSLRVTLTGTWTQYVGLSAYIFGNHDHE